MSSTGTPGIMCAAHFEKLRLFCLDDEQTTCLVCRDSERHAGHSFRPVDEASRHCKTSIQESLQPLKARLDVFYDAKVDYKRTENHIKARAHNTEHEITEHFKNLHQFLIREEEASIGALRKEEAQKSQSIKKRIEALSKNIETLASAIRVAEEQLRSSDHVSFLQSYTATMKMLRQQDALPDPEPVAGTLIDEAKHLGNLTFRVWDKMKSIVSYSPVVLDPNTAHPGLLLANDMTSLRQGKSRDQIPENPERFDWSYSVLGAEALTSGTHSWDVEVGKNRFWTLGVLAESYERKGNVGGRHWEIGFHDGKYSSGPAEIAVRKEPRKIRVQLDWGRAKLSFTDADSNADLRSYDIRLTERFFPFFFNGDEDEKMALKVLPGKISVTLGN